MRKDVMKLRRKLFQFAIPKKIRQATSAEIEGRSKEAQSVESLLTGMRGRSSREESAYESLVSFLSMVKRSAFFDIR